MRARSRGLRIAAVLAVAFAIVASAGSVWGVEGDGSSRDGSVVSAQDAPAADGAQGGASEGPASGGQQDSSGSDDAPTALDVDGNEINDGQVSDTSFLYDAAIADLAGADSYYDGQTVQVRGEAVGEAVRMTGGKEGFVWVTLADVESDSSVSVVMRKADADKIDTYGAYGKTGSRLRVQGTYNLACSEHEGESDIHATVVTVEEKGFVHSDAFDIHAFFPGLAAVVTGAFLMVIFWYIRERSR